MLTTLLDPAFSLSSKFLSLNPFSPTLLYQTDFLRNLRVLKGDRNPEALMRPNNFHKMRMVQGPVAHARVCVSMCVCTRECAQLLGHVQLFATPWTVAQDQAPLCMEFLGKNTGANCHFLLQGIFPTQGSNPQRLLRLLYLAGGFFTTTPAGRPARTCY